MQARRHVGPLALLLVGALSASASAQPAARTVFLRGSAGAASLTMTGWNDYLSRTEGLLSPPLVSTHFDKFIGSFRPEGRIGYMVTDWLSVGAGIARLSETLTNATTIEDIRVTERVGVVDWMVTWDLTAWLPNHRGAYVGGEWGIGAARVLYGADVSPVSDPSNSLSFHGLWRDTHFAGGLFAGYQRPIAHLAFLYVEGGYTRANAGNLSGQFRDFQGNVAQGNPMGIGGLVSKTDFSGYYASAGFGLGRSR